MKVATCRDLKGACDTLITGSSAEEMGENSRKHVLEMVERGDQAHIDAIEAMKAMPKDEQQKWYSNFAASFDSLADA